MSADTSSACRRRTSPSNISISSRIAWGIGMVCISTGEAVRGLFITTSLHLMNLRLGDHSACSQNPSVTTCLDVVHQRVLLLEVLLALRQFLQGDGAQDAEFRLANPF